MALAPGDSQQWSCRLEALQDPQRPRREDGPKTPHDAIKTLQHGQVVSPGLVFMLEASAAPAEDGETQVLIERSRKGPYQHPADALRRPSEDLVVIQIHLASILIPRHRKHCNGVWVEPTALAHLVGAVRC